MNLRLFRLSCLALLWAFAFALPLVPALGAGHAGAHLVGPMVMQGETPSASKADATSLNSTVHDCATLAEPGSDKPEHPGAAAHGDADNPSHTSQMAGCEDMCRMACHGAVILPVAASLPGAFAPAHEQRPVAALETLERDVLVPPPRPVA